MSEPSYTLVLIFHQGLCPQKIITLKRCWTLEGACFRDQCLHHLSLRHPLRMKKYKLLFLGQRIICMLWVKLRKSWLTLLQEYTREHSNRKTKKKLKETWGLFFIHHPNYTLPLSSPARQEDNQPHVEGHVRDACQS